MQSTSVAPPTLSRYPIPNHLLYFDHLHRHHHHHHHLKVKRRKPTFLSFPNTQINFQDIASLTLPTTSKCSKEHQKKLNSDQIPILFDQRYSSTDPNRNPEPQNQKQEEDTDEKCPVLFTNMWWAEVKAAVGQRINVEGLVSSAVVFVKDRHLVLPHVSVPDIRYIDWAELQRRGFKGVVFDKDNTITAPYSLMLWGPLSSSIEGCKSVFGQDIAVFSNSAGLYEYDHDGSKARKLEEKIGIKVIRHRVKKPAGTAEEVEKHFGCKSSQLIMVGDRPFTDIVYGNRNGFLTILTEPLSLSEEPFIVRQVRKLEVFLVKRWLRRGLKPISHSLLPDAIQCVKDPPHS